jgi:hypothetical protein
MPVQTVILNGVKKYRWGNFGKTYPYTKAGKEKAQEQGRAAYSAGFKEKGKKK